ncbi:hypothetical protein [Actinoallomurus sp. CA-150999]|uniref:hypothetical protein n=1 Tax=Actinoallomurus sp. CA-150999 TaxID=3239887 RepID=UPI003D8FC66F
MGEMNIVFAAPDDETAIAELGDWLGRSPVHEDDKLRPEVLAELEALLTGRDSQEIAADPRHCVQITEIFDEGAGVVEAGLVTVTDTLTHALAVADTEALSAAAASHGEYRVQGLAIVARHVAAHGHHMYSFWYF